MQSTLQRALLPLGLLLALALPSRAQEATEHYFPPTYGRDGLRTDGNDLGRHRLYLSTTVTSSFTVEVRTPNGNLFATRTISSGNPAFVELGTANPTADGILNMIRTSALSSVDTTEGLLVSAPQPFLANIRHRSGDQGMSITSKGQIALGTEFRSGHVWTNNNVSEQKAHFISVMASEDGTTVTFDQFAFGVNLQVHGIPSGPISVGLNRGQSYVIAMHVSGSGSVSEINALNGTRIRANKPVAVLSGSINSGALGGGRDMGVAQIVPVESLGSEWVAIRGSGSGSGDSATEVPFIVATRDGTNVFLNGNGSPANPNPLVAGQYFKIPESSYDSNGLLAVATNEPAYFYQVQNANSTNGQSLSLVAPNADMVRAKVEVPFVDSIGTTRAIFVTRVGTTITVGGSPLSGGFSPASQPEIRVYIVNGVTGNLAASADGPYLLNTSAVANNRGAAGYYSGYAAGVRVKVPSGTATTSEGGGQVKIRMRLSTRPSAPVTIPLSVSDPSEGSLDVNSLTFTPTNFSIEQEVTITGVDDTVVDGTVAYQLVTGDPTSADPIYEALTAADTLDVNIQNIDDDAAGVELQAPPVLFTDEQGSVVSFRVRLTSAPSAMVTIPVASSDTSEGVTLTSSLTFDQNNWNVYQVVQVRGVDDPVLDGTVSYFARLGDPSSADLTYNGLTADQTPDQQLGNLDDEFAGVSVLNASGAETTEAGGQMTFQVRLLEPPSGPVTVPLNVLDPSEASISATSLVFDGSNWSTPVTVTVTGLDDEFADGDQAYIVRIGDPSSATDPFYDALTDIDTPDVFLINRDDEVASVVLDNQSGSSTSEAGGTVTFRITLTARPQGPVTIPLASTDTSEATLSAASAVLDDGNWNTGVVITVTGQDDTLLDGSVAYQVTLGDPSSGGDPAFNALGAGDTPDLSLTNTDDETPGTLSFALVSSSVDEADGGPLSVVEVVLDTGGATLDGTITVDIERVGGTTTATGPDADYSGLSASVTFSPGFAGPQSVLLTVEQDLLIEGNETLQLALGAITGPATPGAITSHEVTFLDDDRPPKLLTSGSWSNPADWSPPGLPTSLDNVEISGNPVLDPAGGTVIRSLRSLPGFDLLLAGQVEVLQAIQIEGTLRIAGGATLRALNGGTVDGALALEGGVVELGAATLSVDGALRSAGGTLRTRGGADRIDIQVRGELDLDGLSLSDADAEGLDVRPGATITRLRNVAFSNPDPSAGAAYLTIEASSLNLNAPGLTFAGLAPGQFNVSLLDSDGGGDVVLNLEDRGSNGAGAGPGFESEQGGAAVNWVYAAPDTTRGTTVGFPQTAYDLNTFALYATYAAFRDVDPSGNDRIYALNPNETGADLGYGFRVAPARGDMVGYWWDGINAGYTRVVWVTTTTGYLLRWTDTGASSSQDPSIDLKIADTFTSPPLTDGTLVYAAGTLGGQPRVFAMNQSTGALVWSVVVPQAITSELAGELDFDQGTTKLFAGAGGTGDQRVIDEDFEGGGSFTYLDDAFRGTNQPNYATAFFSSTGGQSGGAAVLPVTGYSSNNNNVQNMSAGFQRVFTVPGGATAVRVQVTYDLRLTRASESNEYAEALLSVDGVLYGNGGADYLARLYGPSGGSNNGLINTGYRTETFDVATTAGSRTLRVGLFMNQRTQSQEYAYVLIDDVIVDVELPGGVIYRIDTMTQLVEVSSPTPGGPTPGSPYPAAGIGMWSVDETGRVTGVDQLDPGMADLPGWPIQPNATAARGDVWVDFVTNRVFWGNEAGEVFGYTTAGAALPNFPVTPLSGAPIRGWPLADGAVVWVADQSGGVAAFNTSAPATTLTPDYRFGAGVTQSRVSQGFTGFRLHVTNSAGKVLVMDREF